MRAMSTRSRSCRPCEERPFRSKQGTGNKPKNHLTEKLPYKSANFRFLSGGITRMNPDLPDAEAAALVALLKRAIAEDLRRVDAVSRPFVIEGSPSKIEMVCRSQPSSLRRHPPLARAGPSQSWRTRRSAH